MPSSAQHPRSRRILRHALIATAAVVLLLAWYIGCYIISSWLHARGALSTATIEELDATIFAPLTAYIDHGWPGASWLMDLERYGHAAGVASR